MNHRDEAARNIGKALDNVLGQGPGQSTLDMHKRILTASMAAGVKGRKRPITLAVAACFLVCVISVALYGTGFLKGQGTPTLRFKIGNAQQFATEGSLAKSKAGSRVPIVFENGSRFELSGPSQARVVETQPGRVTVQLNRGHLDSWINGNGTTEWVVRAGPYTVTVLGTVFSVDWHADEGNLEVRVKEGRVRIDDVNETKSDVTLKAGYLLSANRNKGDIVITEIAAIEDQVNLDSTDESSDETQQGIADAVEEIPPEDTRSAAESGSSETPEHGADFTDLKQKERKRPSKKTKPEWKQYYEKGQFKDAITTATKNDLAQMEEDADLETLWQLANAARYLRRGAVAIRLLHSLRMRFQDTARAHTAAFLIAKTALELNGDKTEAQRWFELYLNESRNGALTEEALGHLMGIHVLQGQHGEATKAAEQYLNRYPDGLFSKRAKEILVD